MNKNRVFWRLASQMTFSITWKRKKQTKYKWKKIVIRWTKTLCQQRPKGQDWTELNEKGFYLVGPIALLTLPAVSEIILCLWQKSVFSFKTSILWCHKGQRCFSRKWPKPAAKDWLHLLRDCLSRGHQPFWTRELLHGSWVIGRATSLLRSPEISFSGRYYKLLTLKLSQASIINNDTDLCQDTDHIYNFSLIINNDLAGVDEFEF